MTILIAKAGLLLIIACVMAAKEYSHRRDDNGRCKNSWPKIKMIAYDQSVPITWTNPCDLVAYTGLVFLLCAILCLAGS